jgi:uncharacterized membrane protein YeaQ/YmgE (transglycosylase-associated protein family)
MTIIAWILLGLVAGLLGSKIVDKRGAGLVVDIVLGVAGALVGGFLFTLAGATGITGFNLWSIFVAVIGSIAVLAVYHAVAGRRAA